MWNHRKQKINLDLLFTQGFPNETFRWVFSPCYIERIHGFSKGRWPPCVSTPKTSQTSEHVETNVPFSSGNNHVSESGETGWCFRNPTRQPVEVGSWDPIILQRFYTSQVVFWDFWTINSIAGRYEGLRHLLNMHYKELLLVFTQMLAKQWVLSKYIYLRGSKNKHFIESHATSWTSRASWLLHERYLQDYERCLNTLVDFWMIHPGRLTWFTW